MIQVGIYANTYNGGLSSVLEQVEKEGMKCIQFNFSTTGLSPMPDQVDEAIATHSKKLLLKHKMAVEAVSGTFNMVHPDKGLRDEGIKRLETIARQCTWLGTNLITLCTGSKDPDDKWTSHPDNNSQQAWHDLRETLDKVLMIAEKYQVFLGIEPEMGNVINSIDKADLLIKEAGSSFLKIVFDPANLFEQEGRKEIQYRISCGLDKLGEHIISAHAKDRDIKGQVVAPGHGILPYPHYLTGLRDIGYKGSLMMHGFDAKFVPSSLSYIKRILSSIQ